MADVGRGNDMTGRFKAAMERFRRNRSNAARIQDFVTIRKALMLCKPCEHRLPSGWRKMWEYRVLPGYHCEGRCDYCQEHGALTMLVPEDGGYWQQHMSIGTISENWRQQQIAVRDRRRVR